RQILPPSLGAAAILLARLRGASITATVLRRSLAVAICDALSAPRIVLPGIPASTAIARSSAIAGPPGVLAVCPAILHVLLRLRAIDIAIEVGISVDVDVHIAVAPVAVAPRVTPSCTTRHTQTERHHVRCNV